MNTIDNKKPIGFFTLVQALESALNYTIDPLALVSLINKQEFEEHRARIIQTFQIGAVDPFVGDFGNDVEFGDISDAVREITFSLYPQTTPIDKPICKEERIKWCSEILSAMDYASSEEML